MTNISERNILYRLLGPDEIIQDGDEWSISLEDDWFDCVTSINCVNSIYGRDLLNWKVRRKTLRKTKLGNTL